MMQSRLALRRFLIMAVLILGVSVAYSLPAGNWVQLGTSHVDGHNDHDKIKVGNHQGSFHALRLRAQGSAVKFDHIVVHYDNGQSQSVPARFTLHNSSSPAMDLPGAQRNIDSVELWYERGNWGDKPEITLMGRP
jgi:hypothetical protein